jgi:hypothetical protein
MSVHDALESLSIISRNNQPIQEHLVSAFHQFTNLGSPTDLHAGID